MSKGFTIRYHAADGYVSGDRPKYAFVDCEDIEDDMSDDDIIELMYGRVDDSFREEVYPETDTSEKEFVSWARKVLEARNAG